MGKFMLYAGEVCQSFYRMAPECNTAAKDEAMDKYSTDYEVTWGCNKFYGLDDVRRGWEF